MLRREASDFCRSLVDLSFLLMFGGNDYFGRGSNPEKLFDSYLDCRRESESEEAPFHVVCFDRNSSSPFIGLKNLCKVFCAAYPPSEIGPSSAAVAEKKAPVLEYLERAVFFLKSYLNGLHLIAPERLVFYVYLDRGGGTRADSKKARRPLGFEPQDISGLLRALLSKNEHGIFELASSKAQLQKDQKLILHALCDATPTLIESRSSTAHDSEKFLSDLSGLAEKNFPTPVPLSQKIFKPIKGDQGIRYYSLPNRGNETSPLLLRAISEEGLEKKSDRENMKKRSRRKKNAQEKKRAWDRGGEEERDASSSKEYLAVEKQAKYEQKQKQHAEKSKPQDKVFEHGDSVLTVSFE